jgi:hypothetical protein
MTTTEPAQPTIDGTPLRTVASIINDLAAVASEQLPRRVVAELVGQCLADLQPISDADLPEMLEHLARHRLDYYLAEPSAWHS